MEIEFLVNKNLPVRGIAFGHTTNVPPFILQFAEYFSYYDGGPDGVLRPAPVIKVDKKSNFKIKKFYLDDLAKLNPVSVFDFQLISMK